MNRPRGLPAAALRLVLMWLLLGLLPALPAAARTEVPAQAPAPAEYAPKAAERLMLGIAATASGWVAVGERGHVLLSDDARHWRQARVPVRAALTAIAFVDGQLGWAAGHDETLLHTRDGGRSWRLQRHAPGSGQVLLDLAFVDARRGVAVGTFGRVLRTEDGGDHWQAVDAPAIADEELNLHALRRLGDGRLLAVGEQGRLLQSRDAGETWSRLRSPARATLFGVAPYRERGALICGLRGQAWVSPDLDRGRWQPLPTGSEAALYGCSTDSAGRGWLVGEGGALFRADLGRSRVQRLGALGGPAYAAVQPISSDRLIVAGEAGLRLLSAQTGARVP